MAITVKHKFVSAIPDGTDATVVRPSNWNDDHDLTGTIPIANGGTGASDAATARTNLGLGTMATQNANGVAITGGSLNGTNIGGVVAGDGAFDVLTGNVSRLNTATATSLTIGTLTYTPANALISSQSSASTYNQVILQNSNTGTTASADFIVNNANSTDTTYYGDFGMNSSGFTGSGAFNQANNVYLTATSADLAIGTTTSNVIHFVINGGATDAAQITTSGTLISTSAPNIGTVASASTITPTTTSGQYNVTALATTATIAIPTGTVVDGQKLIIRIKDNGTGQALTWTTSAGGYRALGFTLPTTTVASKVLYIGCIYNSQDSYWDVMTAVQQS